MMETIQKLLNFLCKQMPESFFYRHLLLNNNFIFSVQSPPYIIKQPPTDEVLFKVKARADENDKPFVIECEAEGEPAPR